MILVMDVSRAVQLVDIALELRGEFHHTTSYIDREGNRNMVQYVHVERSSLRFHF